MTDEPQGKGKEAGRKRRSKGSQTTEIHGTSGGKTRGNDPASANINNDAEITAVPVVGIGASAGGIEALGRFFDAMSPDSGCAFVVVLHLDPDRESDMAHVLSSHTTMPIAQVEDGMRLAPDHVYVIAPASDLEVRNGELHVSKPSKPRGQHHPVDVLFVSLARDQRERAVAIVLSGTGSNGTEGLKEIRAEGGMSLVQAPETAKFDGMPRSALSADLADHILAPEDMPECLLGFVRHGYVAAPADIEDGSPDGPATLDRVLEFLRVRLGQDFRNYKKSTLRRRVHRRLGLKNIPTLDGYMAELRANPDEVLTLADDLMINVTGFFRDADAWRSLTEAVIAPLVAERENGASIRCWVPACSTGEEAYSLAMLITETAEAAGKRFDLKVFATDAQEENLRRAREGVYPEAAMADFPPARLRRFFEELDDSCQVTKELRDLVVFASHNLLHDPPFSRLDLVSCRNFLIYLEPSAQRKIIALFHFALRQGGHLFLGNAETIGRHDDLFETVSKKWRIFRRIGPTRHDLVDYPPSRESRERRGSEESSPSPSQPPHSAADTARRALLDHYAPASVLIDRKGRVLYFHGTTRDYLEHPPGEPTRDLLTMVRDGLASRLRVAIREAWKGKKRLTVNASLRENGALRSVDMTLMPIATRSQDDDFLLVTFAPALPVPAPAPTASADDAGHPTSGEQALQEELKATRAELQNSIEYLETANEELKASNEEATSMNEELQSTNEELETSKEELQSFNEELNTVNSQLQHKIKELEDTTNDLDNLLSGSDAATLFLDNNLSIKWFAPATKDMFDFVSSDIGRPIAHLARKFTDENLLPDAETVLRKLITVEAEVPSDAGRWYLRRMLPYRTQDNRIAGVVVTFNDVTDRKHAAEAVDEARIYSEAIVGTIRQPLLVLNGDLRVQSANAAFYELFSGLAEETEGRLVYELGNGQWDIPRLRALLDEVLSRNEEFKDFEIVHDFLDLGRRSMLLNARKLARNGGREDLILLAIEDITDRRAGENALRESEAQYRTLFDSIDEGFCIIEKVETEPGKPIDFRYVDANPAFERQSGVGDVIGRTIREVVPGESEEWFDIYDAVWRSGEPIRFERGLVTQGRVLELFAFRLEEPARQVAVLFRDITERKRFEEHREILVGELNHRIKNVMATVQAVAAQTLSSAISTEDARAAFGSRLIALGKAHDLLTRENWAGANLAEIVAETVEPHSGGSIRFRINGPRVRLVPSAALSIAMALQELATNAAKYGALSTKEGKVDIAWQLDGRGENRRLALRWNESGGPPVVPPTRSGFGSRLIQRVLAAELGGKVDVTYEPSGVVCTIDAPMPDNREQKQSADGREGQEGAHR